MKKFKFLLVCLILLSLVGGFGSNIYAQSKSSSNAMWGFGVNPSLDFMGFSVRSWGSS